MAWKKTKDTPLLSVAQGFGRIHSKLFELRSKQMTRRALIQARGLRASFERNQARLAKYAVKEKKKK
jgi:hypothetical protein